MSHDQPARTADLLQNLFEATAHTTGEEFFKAFARQLAAVLEVDFCFVSELTEPNKARSLAFWAKGRHLDNIEYEVPGTPCERVVQGEAIQIDTGLNEQYPNEKLFGVPLDSYLGIPLVDRDGKFLGHVVALHTKPMVSKARDFSTLKAFAARATTELERRRAEEALSRAQTWLIQSEKMSALGQITAGVAHEINTPIGVIKSNADLITRSVNKMKQALAGEDDSSANIEKYLQALTSCTVATDDACQRIASTVNNLKRFTRLDEASFQDTDIHEGIDSALSVLGSSLKYGVSVVKDYGELPLIHTSPSELNQVFLTLLKNGSDAIDGSGIITIRTRCDEKNVYVTIEDTGRGIPQEMIETIFDMGLSSKRSRMGLRIGLATSHAIVKAHEGDIHVQSTVGKGTTFEVTLPRRA